MNEKTTSWYPSTRSIRSKFSLTYIGIVAGVLLLLNTYPVIVSQDLVFRTKEQSLQAQASVIATSLAQAETLSVDSVTSYLLSLPQTENLRISVVNQNGFILADSHQSTGYLLRSEIVTALQGNDVFHCTYTHDAFHSVIASPITYRGLTIGCVYLHESDSAQALLLTDIQSNLQRISIATALLSIGLSVVFSRALTARIADLLRGVRSVRQGDYNHKIHIHGKDELSQLGDEFNQLTTRLQTTDEVRRRFVSDASHELNTPLACIKLLADSILHTDGIDTDTVREFVADIGTEANRLTRISEKLLTLTRMDSQVPVQCAPMLMSDVVRSVVHMLSPLAERNQIYLTADLDPNCVMIGTPDDLHQVAFNLIENAIKYNSVQGEVAVGLHAIGEQCFLTITDTGVGIPEEDLPKIFNRFYRVDKARSRNAGGTGLGLSIVRDTVHQHGGTITVQPNKPLGTQFQVAFPRHHSLDHGGDCI